MSTAAASPVAAGSAPSGCDGGCCAAAVAASDPLRAATAPAVSPGCAPAAAAAAASEALAAASLRAAGSDVVGFFLPLPPPGRRSRLWVNCRAGAASRAAMSTASWRTGRMLHLVSMMKTRSMLHAQATVSCDAAEMARHDSGWQRAVLLGLATDA